MGLWKVLFAALAASTLAGCATVTRGLSDQVQINSDPPGATVQTSMSHQCMTPCTLNVQRKDEFNVVISKPGFEPQTVFIGTRVAGSGAAGFAGNVLVGGIVGMGVDAASGATLEHFPNPVAVVLRPMAAAPGGPPPRGRQKGQPVAQRPPAPPPAPPSGFTQTVDASGGNVSPELSEADRTMLMRN
jgi:PEGA domain